MVDVCRTSIGFSAPKMSFDFSNYILSCSPEPFLLRPMTLVPLPGGKTSQTARTGANHAYSNGHLSNGYHSNDYYSNDHSNSDVSPHDINRSCSTGHLQSSLRDSNSNNHIKKTVSFADDCGLKLQHIKYLHQPSSEPPVLSPDVIAKVIKNHTTQSSEHPVLKLMFSQPASDYKCFHDKVIEQKVSLENAYVQDMCIRGSVKVRNIVFDKAVSIRYTTDGWGSHEEVQASYNRTTGQNDTFTFELNVPSDMVVPGAIQFAVCYKTNSEEYWDNNDSVNYVVAVCEAEKEEDTPMFTLECDDIDTCNTATSWQYEDSKPYW